MLQTSSLAVLVICLSISGIYKSQVLKVISKGGWATRPSALFLHHFLWVGVGVNQLSVVKWVWLLSITCQLGLPPLNTHVTPSWVTKHEWILKSCLGWRTTYTLYPLKNKQTNKQTTTTTKLDPKIKYISSHGMYPRGFLSPRRDETREKKKWWEKTSGSVWCECHYHATIGVNQHHEID